MQSPSRTADIDPHMLTSLQKHAQESNLLDTYTSGLFGPKMSHLTRTRERVQSPASLPRVAGWPRERTGRWPRAAAHEWRDLLTRGFPSPAGVLDRFDTLGPGCLRAPPHCGAASAHALLLAALRTPSCLCIARAVTMECIDDRPWAPRGLIRPMRP